MGYEKKNKVIVREQQNLIDLAVQEYGSPEAFFKIISANPGANLTIDSVLSSLVTEELIADDQTEEEIELINKFSLNNYTVVNEDYQLYPPLTGEGAYSKGYSPGYDVNS